LLPLLVVLFLISYGILTLLVVEQGKTIEAQRSLLREMLKDSAQLATLKDKLARDVPVQSSDKAAAPADQKQAVSGSSPSAAPKSPSKEICKNICVSWRANCSRQIQRLIFLQRES